MIRYVLYEQFSARRSVRDHFATFAEAVDSAKASYPIAHYEEDADYPGRAANFLTVDGRVFGIEQSPLDAERDAQIIQLRVNAPLRPAQGALIAEQDGLALFDHGRQPELF